MSIARHSQIDDVELTLRRSTSSDDWWCIERKDHDGRTWIEEHWVNGIGRIGYCMTSARLGDHRADIEGTGAQMMEIADAIERRSEADFKRVAVQWAEDGVLLWSPRNSETAAVVPHARATALATVIRREVNA